MNPTAKQRLTEAKTALLLHAPFFASLLMDVMEIKLGKFPGVDTLGTNGKIIWIDEDYFAKLSLPEAVFALCHEIGHAMWMHMDRGRRYMDVGFEGEPFIPLLFNIAADYVINDMLVKCQVGTMKREWLHDRKYTHDMLVEDVYRDLYKQLPPPPPKGGGGQGGKGQDQGDPGGQGDGDGDDQNGQGAPDGSDGGKPSKGSINGKQAMDTHVYEPSKTQETEMKRAVASAANQAKAMGKLPASLERYVEEFLQPKVSWKEKLRNVVTRAIGRDATTWTSPHRRRLVTQNVYLPSYTGFGAGEIVFAVDTSGSMGQKEFDAGMSELLDIMQTCRPERVFVLSCDARVHTATELADANDLLNNVPKMVGGGGTAFEPVFDWVEENHKEPCVLIYFTDLYGSFPREKPPYPVVWVSTTEQTAPFGETINIDLSEDY